MSEDDKHKVHADLFKFPVEDLQRVPSHLPVVFDAPSLAFSLGIKTKTLWWILLTNTANNQKEGKGFYKVFRIPKRGSSKSFRTIHEPYEALKNVQKALLVKFFNNIEVPKHIGAYVIGRDLLHTVEQHVGKEVIISLDIKNFFPSTKRAWVRQWTRSLGYNRWVANTLSNLVVIPLMSPKGKPYSVLPQGAPTSGVVANFVANERVDKPVLEYLNSLPFTATYTRYSDNIDISFEKDLPFPLADEIITEISQRISQGGYKVNKRKTRVQRKTSPNFPMKVLGIVVNEKANIPSTEYRRLRALVHNCYAKGIDSQYLRAGFDSASEFYTSTEGLLQYWARINPERVEPLLSKFRDSKPEEEVSA